MSELEIKYDKNPLPETSDKIDLKSRVNTNTDSGVDAMGSCVDVLDVDNVTPTTSYDSLETQVGSYESDISLNCEDAMTTIPAINLSNYSKEKRRENRITSKVHSLEIEMTALKLKYEKEIQDIVEKIELISDPEEEGHTNK